MELDKLLIQRKMNKFGGYYYNGKPLPPEIRAEIIRQIKVGIGVTQIGRNLQISHGAVSKIVQNYRTTHSIEPKSRGLPYARKVPSKKNELQFSVSEMLIDNLPQRSRNSFSKETIAVLFEFFKISPVPDQIMKDEISKKTGLTDRQITTWFNNRRSRVRKSVIANLTSPSVSKTSAVERAISSPHKSCEKSIISTFSSETSSPTSSFVSPLPVPSMASPLIPSPLLPSPPQIPLLPPSTVPNLNAMIQLQQLLTAHYYFTSLMQQKYPQK